MKKLTVNSSTDNLPEVLDFIDAELENAGYSRKTQLQIDLAVEEIFVNIANYAYHPGKGNITIQFDFYGEHPLVEIQFIDEGKPFNPLDNADPDITLAAEERGIGGLGILITKKSMDEVNYRFEDHKNILTIKKFLA